MVNSYQDTLNKVFTNLTKFILEDEDLAYEFLDFVTYESGITEEKDLKRLNTSEYKDYFQKFIYLNQYLESKESYFVDYYLQKNPDLSIEEKELLTGIKNKRSSFFEIKSRDKDKFDVYRPVNGINYTVYFSGKTSKLRYFLEGGYLIGSIVKYFDKYYVLEIRGYLPSTEKEKIMFGCALELTHTPYSYFEDNPDNLQKAEEMVQKINKIFRHHFKTDLIITTNDIANDIYDELCDIVEGKPDTLDNIIIKEPESFGYVEKNEEQEDLFNEEEGFKDTGIFVDEELGLFLLPAYGTFLEIFKTNNHKDIKGWSDLIYRYFQDSNIPPSAILSAYNQTENKEHFLEILKEPLGYDEILDINIPIKNYKRIYFDKKMISANIIHIISDIFEDFAKEQEDLSIKKIDENQLKNIGRNDPCPCGSGKKYKKCCMR